VVDLLRIYPAGSDVMGVIKDTTDTKLKQRYRKLFGESFPGTREQLAEIWEVHRNRGSQYDRHERAVRHMRRFVVGENSGRLAHPAPPQDSNADSRLGHAL
jgi:hypothetical protein